MQIHRGKRGIRFALVLGMALAILWHVAAPVRMVQAAWPVGERDTRTAPRIQQAPIVTVASVKGLSRTNYDSQNQCAILTDGQVLCWGRNLANELSSTSGIMSVPVTLTGVSDAVDITGSDSRICILHASEMVSCVGENRGAFGDGTDTDSTTLVTVTEYLGGPPMGGIKDFDTNYEFSCAVMSNGTVRCWGGNALGQVGVGDRDAYTRAVTVTLGTGNALTDVVELGNSSDQYCARTSTGNVYCWGQGKFGEIGNGLITDSLRATLVIALQAPGSPDASLADLTIASGTLAPAFVSTTTSYTAAVPFGTTSAAVAATVNQVSATVVYSSSAGRATRREIAGGRRRRRGTAMWPGRRRGSRRR